MPFEENNKVEYDFWFTSSSNRAIDFIEDFKPFEQGFEGKVDFTPHYVFWECIGCDQRYIESDCFGGGKYCAVEPSNDAIKGREIVLEDLRQKCLFKELKEQNNEQMWFDYIARVHQTCYATINEDCSFNAHKHLNLDFDKTLKCVEDSFSQPKAKWAESTCANSIIDAEISYWKEFGTNIYPSIVINKKTYRGQIEPLSVFNALCASFQDPPKKCLKTLHKEPQQSVQTYLDMSEQDDLVTAGEIMVLVVALIVVNVLVVYCCRRRARREMQNAMNVQIESQVSQYFALSQTGKTNRTAEL